MSRRLKFYRRVRNALLATNNRTDSSIITACNKQNHLLMIKEFLLLIK